MSSIKTVAVGLLVSGVLILSGCGSDAANDEGNTSSTVSSEVAVLPTDVYDCYKQYEQPGGGVTLTTALSATGSLKCAEEYGALTLKFKEGVNELAIAQLVSKTSYKSDFSNADVTVDLKAGTEHVVGHHSTYGDVDCVTKYDVELPLYVYDAERLQEFYFDGLFQEISSTCPEWMNEDDDEKLTTITSTAETTITDTFGNVSTVNSLYKF